MSPKYRLRPAGPLVREGNSYRSAKNGHTIFLPMVMVAVVGLTFLLVSTTEPPEVITLTLPPESKVEEEEFLIPAPEPVTLALPDAPAEIPEKIEEPKLTPKITALRTASVVSDTFVTRNKLPVLDPLPEPELAGKAMVVDAGIPAFKVEPVVEETLPIPAPPVPAGETCPPAPVPDFHQFREQELQITLPGGSRSMKIGDFLDGDREKFREIGQILVRELSRPGISARPQMRVDFNVQNPDDIPTARLPCGDRNRYAVPIIPTGAASDDFTPWMTPQELNRHILAKTCQQKKSFWDQGNWITAVEGRVTKAGVQEFRIVHEKAPATRGFRWHYRIAQSREDFGEKLEAQARRGYRLVQSQMYIDHNNEPRYQAVWHRM